MTRVNVGQLHAGEGRNIVPSHAWMEVEVRGETGEINRDLTAEALTRAQGAAMSFGVECRKRIVGEAIDYQPGGVNHSAAYRLRSSGPRMQQSAADMELRLF